MEGKTIDSGGKKDRFWWDLGRWSGGKTKATSTHDKRRHGMGHRTLGLDIWTLGHGTLGHWEDIIGTLGHYWDMGHWTVEDIGTLGHGTLDILKYTLPCHTTHTTHTHHTPHTHAHVQPSTHVHNHSQPHYHTGSAGGWLC